MGCSGVRARARLGEEDCLPTLQSAGRGFRLSEAVRTVELHAEEQARRSMAPERGWRPIWRLVLAL